MLPGRDNRLLSRQIVREINRHRNLLQRLRLSPTAQQRSNRKPRRRIVRLQKSRRRRQNRKRIVPRNLRRIRQRLNQRPSRVVRRRKNRLNPKRILRLPPSRRRLQRSPRRLRRSRRRRRRKRGERKKRRSRRECNGVRELSEHPEFSQGAFSYGSVLHEENFAARLEVAPFQSGRTTAKCGLTIRSLNCR
jgi:hypothetical protein